MSTSQASTAARQRWAGTTPEERRAHLAPAREAKRRAALDRYIEGLVDRVPEFTPEQRRVIAEALATAGTR